MSRKSIATTLLIVGIFIAGIPCMITTLIILRNEDAPIHKTIAIIMIVFTAISLLY